MRRSAAEEEWDCTIDAALSVRFELSIRHPRA
jgi:hypothetical protein